MDAQKKERTARLITVALLICGVAVVSIMQFRSHLYSAFAKRPDAGSLQATSEQKANAFPLVDDGADTDGDGLTDVQELRTHRTSPYLQDSDSDGVFDGDEIAQGTDPNCPAGATCDSETPSFTPSISGIEGIIGEEPLTPSAIQGETAPEFDPKELRRLLKESGISGPIVESFDDKTLLEVYRETLTELEAQKKPSIPVTAPSTSLSPEIETLLGQLSPQALRALLEQQATTEQERKLLTEVSDEKLKELLNAFVRRQTGGQGASSGSDKKPLIVIDNE